MEEQNRLEEDNLLNIEIWDNSKRAKTLIIVFWVVTGLTCVGIFSGYLELELLKSVQEGAFLDDTRASANDSRQALIGLIQTVLYIVSVVVFLNWFRRAYGNLHRLKISGINHKESMAVWSWCIPILSFFRPVQIMEEIWTKTEEKIKQYDPSSTLGSGGFIVGIWWLLFIISNFIGRYVLKTAFKTDTLEQLIDGSQAMLISDVLQIPEALLVILIVHKLSEMESKLAKEVKRAGGKIIYK